MTAEALRLSADGRLALAETREGRAGTVTDRLAPPCYGHDPVHGIYTPVIRRIPSGCAETTLAVPGLSHLFLRRRART